MVRLGLSGCGAGVAPAEVSSKRVTGATTGHVSPERESGMSEPLEPSPAAPATASSGATSLSMLDRVRAEDPAAWKRLVELYSPLIYSWARRSGLRNEDAADLLQEVWRAVAGNVARFRRTPGEGSFRGWLWAISRNKLRDHFRARQGSPEAVGGSDARDRIHDIADDEPPDSDESGPGSLLHRALELIRGDFEERTWQAFWRSAVDGLPAAAVATELSLSVDSVYQAKSRVLRRLREEMGDLLSPEP